MTNANVWSWQIRPSLRLAHCCAVYALQHMQGCVMRCDQWLRSRAEWAVTSWALIQEVGAARPGGGAPRKDWLAHSVHSFCHRSGFMQFQTRYFEEERVFQIWYIPHNLSNIRFMKKVLSVTKRGQVQLNLAVTVFGPFNKYTFLWVWVLLQYSNTV